MTSKYDIIIVGAGLSGLTAAYEIHKKNPHLKLLILEAWWEIGGRTRSAVLKTKTGTDKWDLGGQWVGRSQAAIQHLMKELGIKIYPQSIIGFHMVQSKPSEERKLYKEDRYPMSATATGAHLINSL